MRKMKPLEMTAFALVSVGAINIGLGVLGVNVIEMLLGTLPTVTIILNAAIGLAGVFGVYKAVK